MRGINSVVISGNVSEQINFGTTGSGMAACSFSFASDRHSSGDIITYWGKINVYGDGLVRACKAKLAKGVYVLVTGELMNRDGQYGELTEIRAREIIFLTSKDEGVNHGGKPEGD